MIYKIDLPADGEAGLSGGFEYAGSKAEALRFIREYRPSCEIGGTWPNYRYWHGTPQPSWEKIKITAYPTPSTKGAWLEFVNTHGAHPDNG